MSSNAQGAMKKPRGPKFTTVAGVAQPLQPYWPSFKLDYERGDKVLRTMGANASEAFMRWCAQRGSLKRRPAARPAPRPASARDAPAVAVPVRMKQRAADRAAAPAYRYKAGAKYVVYGLPGWPVVECTRDTNGTPGTSTHWRLIGRQA